MTKKQKAAEPAVFHEGVITAMIAPFWVSERTGCKRFFREACRVQRCEGYLQKAAVWFWGLVWEKERS